MQLTKAASLQSSWQSREVCRVSTSPAVENIVPVIAHVTSPLLHEFNSLSGAVAVNTAPHLYAPLKG